MISAWWMIPIFIIGVLVGLFLFCLCCAGGDDE